MSPEEMQRRIREAVAAVEAMSDETIMLSINAGLLDRRYLARCADARTYQTRTRGRQEKR